MPLWCFSPDIVEEPTLGPVGSNNAGAAESSDGSSSGRKWRFSSSGKRRDQQQPHQQLKHRSAASFSTGAAAAAPIMSPAAANVQRKIRRSSLQNPFTLPPAIVAQNQNLNGSMAAYTTDEEGPSRRKQKRVSKVEIGQPEGFKHLAAGTPTNWRDAETEDREVEAWRGEIERTFKPATLSNAASANGRPKGPRTSTSTSSSRPDSFGAAGRSSLGSENTAITTSTTSTTTDVLTPFQSNTSNLSRSLSSPGASYNYHYRRTSEEMGISISPSAPVFITDSNVVNRASSVGGGRSQQQRIRRKPVPKPLPVIDAEVSPFPTVIAGPKDDPRALPIQFQESEPETKMKEKKELVPLLGIPGDGETYVTQTTKARWDGAMADIVKALREPSA